MKTITIITLQNVRNYGSVLQALATQKIFESLGCEVGFFNYLRSNNATPWVRIKNWTNKKPLLTKVLIGALLYPTFVCRIDVLRSSWINTWMCRRRYVLLWLILRNWNLHLTSIVQVPTRHGIVGGTGEFFQNCFLLLSRNISKNSLLCQLWQE